MEPYASVSATPSPLPRGAPFAFERFLDPATGSRTSSSLVVPRLFTSSLTPTLPPFLPPPPLPLSPPARAAGRPAPSFSALVDEILGVVPPSDGHDATSASQGAEEETKAHSPFLSGAPRVAGEVVRKPQQVSQGARPRPAIRKFADVDMDDLDPLALPGGSITHSSSGLARRRNGDSIELEGGSGATVSIVGDSHSFSPRSPTPGSYLPSPSPSPSPSHSPAPAPLQNKQASGTLLTFLANEETAEETAKAETPQAQRTDAVGVVGSTIAERLMAYIHSVERYDSDDSDDDHGEDGHNALRQPRPSSIPPIQAPVPRPAPPDGAGEFGFSPFGPSLLSQFSPRHHVARSLEYSTPHSPPAQLRSVQRMIASSPYSQPSTSASYRAPSPMTATSSRSPSVNGYHYVSPTHASLSVRHKPAAVDDDADGWYGSGLKLFGEGSAYTRYRSKPSPRANAPLPLRTALQRQIIQSWQAAEPTSRRKAQIRDLLKDITDTLRIHTTSDKYPRGDRYRVDVFGSVAWGGETGDSGDVDLVIIDTELPLGYHPDFWRTPPDQKATKVYNGGRVSTPNTKVPKIYDIRVLADILRDAGMTHVKAIPNAKTPIVKFRRVDLQCDICTNDLGGWYNSALILAYCELSPYVLRPMVHTLKKWLGAHNLNDPSGRSGPPTMSSYCMTLMAIAYLQHRGVLPNLQSKVNVSVPLDASNKNQQSTVWLSWGRSQGEVAHIWFARRAPEGWTSAVPSMTADEAVRGFFEYFSVTFNPKAQFVSVANGGVCNRRQVAGTLARERADFQTSLRGCSNVVRARAMAQYDAEVDAGDALAGKCDAKQPSEWNRQHLVVQDPFLWQKNCAQGMSGRDGRSHEGSREEIRFFKTVKATHRLLRDSAYTFLTDILDRQRVQNAIARGI